VAAEVALRHLGAELAASGRAGNGLIIGGMKVLDLRCAHGHGFEGWFASEDDYLQQGERGLVECPLCGDKTVSRLPSAPRLNFGAQAPREVAAPAPPAAPPARR
jgi:hypothetical protein